MLDRTGMALVSYVLRVVKDIVNRNPRFRRTLGDVGLISSNKLNFGNVQVLCRDVSTDAGRQSPDYFISTMTGRAILTQVGDADGKFIEYVVETDASGLSPAAGVYYLNVDSVDEGTRDVQITLDTYHWYEGRIQNAGGTRIGLAAGIDGTRLTATDNAGLPVEVQAAVGYLYLLSAAKGLILTDDVGRILAPRTEYWVEAPQTEVLIASTVFGTQVASLPPQFLGVALVDQDGFVLRPNQDYLLRNTDVLLAKWTPSGQAISIQGLVKLDPTVPANLIAAENILPVTLAPGEELVPDQCFISTGAGNHMQVTPNADGTIVLPYPLPPGGWCRYEVRARVGLSTCVAKKNAINKYLLPGLRLAIGDQVEVGDQCAILVSPTVTETYRVYGAKPGITFTLEIRANDPTTSDELAKMVMRELLYQRRENLESDGLSLYEASFSTTGGSRDDSGTAPTYATALIFTGAADWREFEPLVTRITGFEVTTSANTAPFPNGPAAARRFQCLQATGFIPDYR